MADSVQTLQEFTQNLLSDVTSGALSIDEAYAACSQYAYLREALAARRDELARAALEGDDELLGVFTGVLNGVLDSLSDLPNFQHLNPDAPETESEIREAGTLRKVASERIRESVRPDTDEYRKSRRDFIHDLVTRYSARGASVTEDSVSQSFDRSLAAAASEATSAQTKDRFAEQMVASVEAAGATLTPDQRSGLLTEVKSAVSARDAFITDEANRARKARLLYETLAENPDLKRPDVLVSIVLDAPGTEPVRDTVTRGLKLSRVAAELDVHEGRGGSLTFFTADGTKGVLKGLQQGADGLLSVVADPVRDMVYHQKVNGVLRHMLSDTQQFVDRLGENFVKSALFTHIAQDLTKQLSDRQPMGGARSMVGDVFTSVFRGPLAIPAEMGARERILDYFELARANAQAPAGFKFLPQGIAPWNVFRKRERGYGVGVTGTRRRGFFPSLSWMPFFSLGSVGRAAGDLFSSVVDRTTSFLLTNPSLPMAMRRARRRAAIPTPLSEDMPKMVALAVVVAIVLLFILPTPLNLSQISHSSKVVSLLTGLLNREGEQGGGGGSVNCDADPTNPLCTFKSCPDCGWPTNGWITQGPQVSCGNGSHASGSDANGIDMSTSGNVPIYAVRSGTVLAVHTSCTDNTGKVGDDCGDGYGNYVTIKTDNGYTVIYAHMKSALNPSVTPGASIAKGTQIGWMDQTGSSTGQHLHFGVLSGGSVLDLLPDTPVNKSEVLGCLNNNLKCLLVGKSCPATFITAQ